MTVDPQARPGRPDPDLALILRHQAGETDAFGWLWRKYEPRLRRFFIRATGSEADADDLAGETFLAALRALPQFRQEGPATDGKDGAAFGTYLHAIARNQLLLWLRRRRRHREVPLDLASPAVEQSLSSDVQMPPRWAGAPVEADPSEVVFSSERRDSICRALAHVDSDPQFSAILLHYVAGWTHDDVGRFLGAKPQSINTRLQDGRKSLRRSFERFEPLSV